MTRCEPLASEVPGMLASGLVVLVAQGQFQSWTRSELDTGIVSPPRRESVPSFRPAGRRAMGYCRPPSSRVLLEVRSLVLAGIGGATTMQDAAQHVR